MADTRATRLCRKRLCLRNRHPLHGVLRGAWVAERNIAYPKRDFEGRRMGIARSAGLRRRCANAGRKCAQDGKTHPCALIAPVNIARIEPETQQERNPADGRPIFPRAKKAMTRHARFAKSRNRRYLRMSSKAECHASLGRSVQFKDIMI